MNTMMQDFTKVFQDGSDLSIELYTRVIGIEAKIYFPQSFGHYSGNNNDITFSDEPELVGKVLIPEIYNMSKTPRGGVVDTLFQDTFKLYVKHSLNIPEKSKIVVISPYIGLLQFLVSDQESPNTFFGKIYREYTITPYLNIDKTIEDLIDNADKLAEEDYQEPKDDHPHNDDMTISKSDSENPKYKYRDIG
jgi:hypothetical protein